MCNKCYIALNPIFEKFKQSGYDAFALYSYSEQFRSMLFQFKGCFDYELAPLFLERILIPLKLKYHNYVLVPAPSSKEADKKRGFNHVVEIYRCLNRPILRLIEKTEDVKQSSQGKDRDKIKNYLTIKNGEKLTGKNVLLVDDVRTSGATLSAMISLVKKYRPRRIKILVLAITSHDIFKGKSL